MHPAWSVILFSTLSGAGYGLLTLLGLGALFGLLPPDRGFAFATLGTALVLVTAGLLASTGHLGRPERAWRAFSQFRSSWLSREGVMAVVTYPTALAFAAAWLADVPVLTGALGLATCLAAVLTVICTGMIYASLPPIPDWHQPWTVPAYLALSAATGSLLLVVLASLWEYPVATLREVALLALAAAFAVKEASWRHIRKRKPVATVADATGLAALGTAKLFEAPHTETTWLLREMAYKVARKHRLKLRGIVRISLFALPLACLALALPPVLALISAAVGVLAERWLFFAEARHTVTLYYGAAEV
ncbi:MAG: DmsC/YnfH family molybdoenzyme membrane anchor subunit [Geminicoccaceae bacterium]